MSKTATKKILMDNVVGDAISLPAGDRARCTICGSFYWRVFADHVECSFCKSIFVMLNSEAEGFGEEDWWEKAPKGRVSNIVDKQHKSSDWIIFPAYITNQRRKDIKYPLSRPMVKMFFTPAHRNLGAAR